MTQPIDISGQDNWLHQVKQTAVINGPDGDLAIHEMATGIIRICTLTPEMQCISSLAPEGHFNELVDCLEKAGFDVDVQ